MSEFTAPTGERAEAILKAARETLAAGQTIRRGAPELPEMKKRAGLEDITGAERDWAFEQIQAEQAAAAEPQGQDGEGAGDAGEGDGADNSGGDAGDQQQEPDAEDGESGEQDQQGDQADAQDGDGADAEDSADPEEDGGDHAEASGELVVHCAACAVDVDPADVEGPTDTGKVYVTHHGARQGVPIPENGGTVVAFKG